MSRKNFSSTSNETPPLRVRLMWCLVKVDIQRNSWGRYLSFPYILTRNNRKKLREFTVVQSINIHAVKLSDIFTYWFPEEYGWFTRSQNGKHMFEMQKHIQMVYSYILLQINDFSSLYIPTNWYTNIGLSSILILAWNG